MFTVIVKSVVVVFVVVVVIPFFKMFWNVYLCVCDFVICDFVISHFFIADAFVMTLPSVSP